MKYKVGDRVRIVSKRVNAMNSSGKMDKYLGTVMTIRNISSSDIFPYIMEEDNGFWNWNNDMIEGLVQDEMSSFERDHTPRKMTVSEIEEQLGYKIEIVAEEDMIS